MGDIVTDGRAEGLSIPLPTIGMDLKTSADETNTYLNSVVGQVEVLAITADAVCLDIDLSWALSQPEGNTLTICDNAPDLTKGRPSAFEAKSGSGHVLIRFERAKN